MKYQYYFEKLELRLFSRVFIPDIYEITKGFPADEKFGLTFQIRRASVSIASNLAEGSSRGTKKDQAHFTTNSLFKLNGVIEFTDYFLRFGIY